MVQSKVPVMPAGMFPAWQVERPVARSKRTLMYVTIQTTSKHFVSSLNSRQAVHKR